KNGIEKYVFWAGWIDHKELFQFIRAANIGIIPHHRSAHVDTTIPNKIFDYMACELPVIASNAPPMRRIIEETGAGLVFESGNSSDLAQAVVDVYSSELGFGKNGYSAVSTKYNWSIDKQRLLIVVNNFS
ncbi:MAG: hypothetical protein DRP93_08940, partial [Candidatus Neomarinimicrobiota bacterium]